MRKRKEKICHWSENGMEMRGNSGLGLKGCDFNSCFFQHWAMNMPAVRTRVKKSECMQMEYVIPVQ